MVKSVLYCERCTLPPEYCEYSKDFNKCKPWLVVHAPEQYPELLLDEELKELSLKDPQDEEGDCMPVEEVKRTGEVLISTAMRGKKKFLTVVQGLEKFGHKLKDVAKTFRNKFASSSSVTANKQGEDVVIVQGDLQFEVIEFLNEKMNIPEENMFYIDSKTKKKEPVQIF